MTHTTKFGLKRLLEYFCFNTKSVAPLAISSFGFFFWGGFSCNTVLSVKFLIAIILGCCFCALVAQEFNSIVQ